MKINKLRKGDIIGIVSPSHIANENRYKPFIYTLESLGFRVKLGENIYKETYGYLATAQERADDFNNMVSDVNVKMILFGGGEGGNELLPYINYENIKNNPKYICSYSDGTTILNAIYAMTGVTTYYGQGPNIFADLRYYDYMQFSSHFIEDNCVEFISNSEWKILNEGICEGKLIGGYPSNFALLLGNKFFKYDKQQKYILFLEDLEEYSELSKLSSLISHMEQSDFIFNVAGLIFGHYSDNVNIDLLNRLKRFGLKYKVPVIYNDDFGHGVNHAILPIGRMVKVDTKTKKMTFIN